MYWEETTAVHMHGLNYELCQIPHWGLYFIIITKDMEGNVYKYLKGKSSKCQHENVEYINHHIQIFNW